MHDRILPGNLPTVSALAYLGDAAHSLCIRRMLLEKGISRSKELNAFALEYVTAERQAEAFLRIEPFLSDEERDLFKRAFNSTHLNKPKHVSHKDYRTATGFEAILGMHSWLGNEERISELVKIAYGEPEA